MVIVNGLLRGSARFGIGFLDSQNRQIFMIFFDVPHLGGHNSANFIENLTIVFLGVSIIYPISVKNVTCIKYTAMLNI